MNVVLFGKPMAGKSTLLLAFAKETGHRVESFGFSVADNGRSFEHVGLHVQTNGVRLITLAGGVLPSAWTPLIKRAGGVVLVADAQTPDKSRDALHELSARSVHPCSVILTKTDLVSEDALSTERARWESHPLFETRVDHPPSLSDAVRRALELAGTPTTF